LLYENYFIYITYILHKLILYLIDVKFLIESDMHVQYHTKNYNINQNKQNEN